MGWGVCGDGVNWGDGLSVGGGDGLCGGDQAVGGMGHEQVWSALGGLGLFGVGVQVAMEQDWGN